ncbi:MAG: cytochrome [Verrucomicrobiaceae bacterium]|nr:cytochrome [Verrucomicrobiaceae bacterium]
MASDDDSKQSAAPKSFLVWDLPVRIFHWTLIVAIVAAYVTNKMGVAYFRYHVWCGYTVIVLVAFRIVWGIIGTRHARFWNFVRGPITTLRYARGLARGREQRYAGHNPLGALMVIALLVAVLVQAVTGLFGNDEIFNVGPLYGYISNEFSLQLTSLHRQLFYWILGAIAIHVIAVLAHSLSKRENLIKAMITGHKPHHHVDHTDAVHSSRTWLAALLVVVFAVGLAWVVLHAPIPATDVSY